MHAYESEWMWLNGENSSQWKKINNNKINKNNEAWYVESSMNEGIDPPLYDIEACNENKKNENDEKHALVYSLHAWCALKYKMHINKWMMRSIHAYSCACLKIFLRWLDDKNTCTHTCTK